MKTLFGYALCPILLINFYFSQAQHKVDSLIVQLGKSSHDTAKVQNLMALYNELIDNDPDQALNFTRRAFQLSKAIKYDRGIIDGQIALGTIYELRASYDSALYFFEEALIIAENVEYKRGIIDALTGRGKTLRSMSRWEEAIQDHLKCLELAQLDPNDSMSIANSYNNLGNIYSDQHQFEKALDYYQRCIALIPVLNRMKAVATLNIGFIHFRLQDLEKANDYFLQSLEMGKVLEDEFLIAHCYQKIGFIKRDLGQFNEAKRYYNLAIKQFESLNDRSNMAYLYSNLGNVYYDNEDYHDAIKQYKLSLAIQQDINDRVGQCYSLVALGTAYGYVDEYQRAEQYLFQARKLSSEIGVQLITRDAALRLSEFYAKQKNFEKAYEYHIEFKSMDDSIFNSEKIDQIAEMETKYQADSKNKEIELLNAEKKINLLQLSKRESQRNYLIVVALVILILAFILYYMYKIKVRSNAKLKELDHLKSRFFTNISHEFRTPLTLILSPLEQKLSEEKDADDKSIFNIMHRNASRLLELINQLLDLSKLESGNMKLKVGMGDVNSFIKTMVSSFYSLADQRKIEYVVDIPDVAHEMYFDQDKLQKIVSNLLSNAFKFTPEHGRIIVTVSNSSNDLSLSVSDSGKGISEGDQAYIFERFNQLETNEDSSHVGSGVGLSLTKELVELHHGKIKVKSIVNQGSEFIVTIPSKENAYKKDDKIPQDLNVAVQGNKMDEEVLMPIRKENVKENAPMVLLVEDNDDVRNYIRKMLMEKYHVIEAKNGLDGLGQATEHMPDLIISDLMMPKMTGIEFCATIKKERDTSHIPVILLTAKADMESKIESLEIGADDYLTKPFDAQELMQRVKNLIEQRKKLRQHYGRIVTLQPKDISITPPDELFLKKAFDIVEKNMSNGDFTVEQFQKELGMSRMQLHRKLKALTDCSSSEFIRTQRLKRAAQLLQSNSVSVSEAAYTSGFNNLSYFAKCFKKQFDITPSEYVVRYKN